MFRRKAKTVSLKSLIRGGGAANAWGEVLDLSLDLQMLLAQRAPNPKRLRQ